MAIHTSAYLSVLNITLLTSSVYLLCLSKSYDVTLSQHRECVAISIYQLFLRYKCKPAPVAVNSGRNNNNFLTVPEEFRFSESLFEAGVQSTCPDALSVPVSVPPAEVTLTPLWRHAHALLYIAEGRAEAWKLTLKLFAPVQLLE